MAGATPKVFVSYSWTSPGHRDRIRSYAERLVGDGIDVILDQWDLSEGQDKYAFMEKMVTDDSVTHVVIFSDLVYAEKADARKAGVGTESQIISKEIYEKIDQKKFIPVVCERDEEEEPCLPVFLGSRLWVDFSTAEAVNSNWESLLRALYDKPIHEKPAPGRAPAFLDEEEGRPTPPTTGKLLTLRTALLESKPTVAVCRSDFLEAAIEFAASQTISSQQPDQQGLEEDTFRILRTLHPLRDQLIDWLMIECRQADTESLENTLVEFLEQLLPLKYRKLGAGMYNELWFEAHGLFVYEVFLYVIASLVKTEQYKLVRELLSTHYLVPEHIGSRERPYRTFEEFRSYSHVLDAHNKRSETSWISPVGHLFQERASRRDLPFSEIIQAELVIFMLAALTEDARWYPSTMVYAGFGGKRFPLFIRAMQHKHFRKITDLTGIRDGGELRKRFKAGCERIGTDRWTEITFHAEVSFWDAMRMNDLDTLQ